MVSKASDDQVKLRLPNGMRQELHDAAEAAGRTMNSEAVHRLQSYTGNTEDTMAKGYALTIRLSDETKATLDRLSQRGPYRISMTSIVERGIELAAKELEELGQK